MKKTKNILIGLLAFMLAISLVYLTIQKPGLYEPERYFSQAKQDSLMVGLVTYIGTKPKNTDYLSRHDPAYTSFYQRQSKDFLFYRLFDSGNGKYFFYVLRPARHPLYEKRAIGGWFLVDNTWNILDVEEVFATFAMEDSELKHHSESLFRQLITEEIISGNTHPLLVEWPDDRCRYDKLRHEWRYDVID